MGVAFDQPLWLVLLPLGIAFTLALHAGARRRLGAGRRRAALIVRALLIAALVFALAGFRVVLPVDRLATIFVVDLSDSVGQAGREDALAFLRQSLVAMPSGDQAGIVAFGADALVERLPSDLRDVDRLASTPVRSATDIGAALRLASALFPDDAEKRIVLLSDGNDTTGSGTSEAALAGARGVQVETHTLGRGGGAEVLVERLSTPSTARLGEEIEATAEIRSTVAQKATVRLFADGAQVGQPQLVDLQVGSNRVVFRVKPTQAGFHTFRVVVEAPSDTFHANDRADSNTIVKGEPRILVVRGDDTVAGQLVAALEAERQNVDSVIPEALPSDLAGLATYDSVILVDVPRLRLTDAQLTALQVDVRDLGKGLVMVGGPHSYGAGGYTKTPLEEALPVDMGVRDRQKEPDVALVVVIDKSGSMDACHCNSFGNGQPGGGGSQMAGVRKVDIGKEAILRAAAALNAQDELGVVAFDSSAHWVVHTAPLGSLDDLKSQIAGISANGETNIFSGLDQAVGSLEHASATRRHIILLTDGWSRSGAYDQIIARMKAAGITLSTVGAGGGSAPVLQQLAQQGGGRYYAAANEASIPDIFLKETQQVSGEQIVEETFHPIQTGSSPILRGLDQGFPQLYGYNGTTAKSAANTVLVTARDDPLLAQWQYGLGRSVAWTSDTSGKWAKAWIGWSGFERFFSQLVAWTFPGEETGGIEATFDTRGQDTTLRVESVDADGSPRDFYSTTATVVEPDLTTRQVQLSQTAPGVYESRLGELDPGAYAIRVTQTRPGASPLGRTVGLVAPTAAEYRELEPNDALLSAIRSATGGKVADDPQAVWRHDLTATSSLTDLWPLLLILAMLLWPLDVALRRVSIGRRELADARAWLRNARRRRVAAPTATVETMLAARGRAGAAAARTALMRAAAAPSTSGDSDSGITAGGGGSGRPVAARAQPSTVTPAASPITRPSPPAVPSAPSPPASSPASGPSAASPVPAPAPAAPAADAADTLARLRQAKRRARGGS